jgi:hypothetical protein
MEGIKTEAKLDKEGSELYKDSKLTDRSPDGAVERGYSNPMFNVTPPACISTVPVHPLQDLTYGVENPLYQEQCRVR